MLNYTAQCSELNGGRILVDQLIRRQNIAETNARCSGRVIGCWQMSVNGLCSLFIDCTRLQLHGAQEKCAPWCAGMSEHRLSTHCARTHPHSNRALGKGKVLSSRKLAGRVLDGRDAAAGRLLEAGRVLDGRKGSGVRKGAICGKLNASTFRQALV